MALPVVVPDASVLLKWVLPSDDEPHADRARQLREAIVDESVRALVPSLWLYEIGNTVARRFPAHAAALLNALVKFGLEEVMPKGPVLTRTLELTARFEVSFYDAVYHAVALVNGGVFVTADARYVERVAEIGQVILLSSWEMARRPSTPGKGR
jgi:predicted nucleic acid-binding protein